MLIFQNILRTPIMNDPYIESLFYVVVFFYQSSIAFHIGTSHLTCTANQWTGFYMKCNTGVKWVK